MSGSRIDQLTFTRFLAAFAIVIFHYGSGLAPFDGDAVQRLLKHANVGVSYFFLLSGFIMMLAYADRVRVSPWLYYRHRFARIYPVYMLALLAFLPFAFKRADGIDASALLLNAALVQSWVPSKALSLNSPGWSLSTEMFFYALFPFLLRGYRDITTRTAIIGAIALFLVTQIITNGVLASHFYQGFPSPSHSLVYYVPAIHLNEFIVGNVTGLCYLRHVRHNAGRHGPWIAIVAVATAALLYVDLPLERHNGLMAITFVPTILLISTDKGLISRLFSTRPAVFLGEISFGIYILQEPVHMAVSWLTRQWPMLDAAASFYIYLAVLMVIAGFTYQFVEVPARNFINRSALPLFRRPLPQ